MNDGIKDKWHYIGMVRTVYEKYPEDVQLSICGRDKSDGLVWIADHFKISFMI